MALWRLMYFICDLFFFLFFFFNFLRIEIPCGISLYFFFTEKYHEKLPRYYSQAIRRALEFYIKSMFLRVFYGSFNIHLTDTTYIYKSPLLISMGHVPN